MKQANSGSKRTLNVVIGSVLVALALGIGIRMLTQTTITVRAVTVNYGDLVSAISTNGKVEPIQGFQAHASDPGVVQAVYVREGQTVPAGAVLLRLDTASAEARVAAAKASQATNQATAFDVKQGGTREERITLSGDLERTRLQLTQAQADVATLEKLQGNGAASASEVATARQRLQTQQSALASLEQRYNSRYGQTDTQRVQAAMQDSNAALAAAQKSLANAIVRSPYAGTVYALPVKQYDFVPAGERLVEVADLQQVQVRAYFDEPEIGKLAIGQRVEVKWDARPERLWHGHITHTPTTVIQYGTRSVGQCLIAIDDAKGDLLPDTNVNVKVTTQQKPHVLSLAREALRTQGTENYVFVVHHGRLRRTPIQVGALNLMLVQILSGLQQGDVVALSAVSNDDLSDGLKVKVVRE